MKNIKVYKKLQKKLLAIKVVEWESIGIFRYGEDIVIADGYVEQHTDNTEPGKDTIMAILLNEGEFDFNYDGTLKSLPVGSVFRFDGNKQHALITCANEAYKKQTYGRFAAIIWDVPIDQETNVLITQLQDRIKELAN